MKTSEVATIIILYARANYLACLLVQLFPNCTQKHVITYTKRIASYPGLPLLALPLEKNKGEEGLVKLIT